MRIDYDTRNVILDTVIQDAWEPNIKAQWEENKQQVTAGLLAELGPVEGERKLENYRAMGPAPWSVVFGHTVLLRQIRSAFAHGDYFPALVGACALGERILHQLVHALRGDYMNHVATTQRVRSGNLRSEWGTLITVLHGWGVFSDQTAEVFRRLEEDRHQAIHFNADLEASEPAPALMSLLALQEIVEQVFGYHGDPPRYIADTPGMSYIALEAEQEPLIRRVFIPNCVLVSPAHYAEHDPSSSTGWVVYDDLDYACDPLTDAEFAARVRERNG
jgi:hypothetical protein